MVSVGSDFPGLNNLVDLDGNAKDVKHNGEVILIDFWATWCPPCQGPMQHNQDMMNKNPNWAGKVRIVCVSLD